jgi:hypothetical protein
MRLGKEEARGFIEEPVEVSDTRHAPDESEPHRAEDPTATLQHAPRNTPEDQTAPTG